MFLFPKCSFCSILFFLLSINLLRKRGKGTFHDSRLYKKWNKGITLTNIDSF